LLILARGPKREMKRGRKGGKQDYGWGLYRLPSKLDKGIAEAERGKK